VYSFGLWYDSRYQRTTLKLKVFRRSNNSVSRNPKTFFASVSGQWTSAKLQRVLERFSMFKRFKDEFKGKMRNILNKIDAKGFDFIIFHPKFKKYDE
jgi:hypothetical protein